MADNEQLSEAERMMTVCNACRYCEGFCGVWRAMEYRRSFPEGDLNYLANLCHDCSECYYACQYAPPHEWDINPPLTFAIIRKLSYEKYAWPKGLASAFKANGLVVSLTLALSLIVFLFGVVYFGNGQLPAAAVSGGNFYEIVSHNAMVAAFGAVAAFSLLALCVGSVRFCRDIGERMSDLLRPSTLITTLKEVLRLEYLDGGGWGCTYPGEESSQLRRWFHHLTFYGFLLCFASTSLAAVYHYLFHLNAPYAYTSLPVLLGTTGGVGILIGPAGLLTLKCNRNRDITDANSYGMDTAFLVLLFLTGTTGLLLLVLRETAAVGSLLIIHLGVVMALFLTMPYGKFVHGFYRFIAIAKYALERERKETLGI